MKPKRQTKLYQSNATAFDMTIIRYDFGNEFELNERFEHTF